MGRGRGSCQSTPLDITHLWLLITFHLISNAVVGVTVVLLKVERCRFNPQPESLDCVLRQNTLISVTVPLSTQGAGVGKGITLL